MSNLIDRFLLFLKNVLEHNQFITKTTLLKKLQANAVQEMKLLCGDCILA